MRSFRKGFVSFFNKLDTGKELCSWPVSFFNEVDTIKELSSKALVSFFNEVDTIKKKYP